MSLEDMLKKAGSNIKKAILIPMIAVATMMPMKGEGAVTTQYPPVTNQTDYILDISIINNDGGTIYDSVQINLDIILGNVADWIIANNPSYTNSTRQQIYNKIVPQILGTPSSEVCDGWNNPVINGNNLNENHINGDIDIDYTGLYATQDNPNQDMMTIRIGIPISLTDKNKNNIIDRDEMIIKTTELKLDTIIATDTDGSHWSGKAYSYSINTPNTITTTNNLGGTITPKGTTVLDDGSYTNVVSKANNYYVISNIVVNGISDTNAQGKTSYTNKLNNVTNDINISVNFAPKITTNSIPVPYEWLAQFGITNNQEQIVNQDLDTDGMTTAQEYILDTNPTNKTAPFAITSFGNTGNNINLQIPYSSTNRTYELQKNADLISTNWNTTYSANGTGSEFTMIDNNTNKVGFYRINVKTK
jgi:hypothetical protein